MKKPVILFLSLTLLVFILAACSQAATTAAPAAATVPAATTAPAAATAPAQPAALDGKALTEKTCTQCHDLGRVQNARGSADQWKAVVERMIQKFPGSNLTPPTADEKAAIIKYLSDTYK